MPSINFTLPHWAYWVGLIVFPIIAMVLARRARPKTRIYELPLGYLILVTGGILGLHRFYLKNFLGLIFLPIFLFILYANAAERETRSAYSDASNLVRVAERTIERETPKVETAESDLPGLQADVDSAEAGSLSLRSAERKLKRAKGRITKGHANIVRSEADLLTAGPVAEKTAADRAFWANAARYAFYTILALLAIDAVLLPALVRSANAKLEVSDEAAEEKAALEAAEAMAKADPTARKQDHEYVENWIDKISIYAGEFVSYWAVIAVFVYYYEVIARYVFNSPSNWAHESMYLMFGMQYLIAGSYAMLTDAHVKVDIFYAPWPRKKKAWVDLATSIFFFIFAGTLLVTSYIFAFDAIAVPSGNSIISDWARGQVGFGQMVGGLSINDWTDPAIRWGEISFNEWEVPLWPMKWMMVVGGLLLVLQGISKIGKDIRAIRQGA